MGFLEKVKNMFTEEVEEDTVKVEKVDKVKKEIISSFSDKSEEPEKEEFSFKEEPEIENKPIFLDDNAFNDLDKEEKNKEPVIEEKRENTKKLREDKYVRKGNYKESLRENSNINELNENVEEKKIFKPTPIISPVYGILDKNYHKEDIVSKNDVINDSPKDQMIDRVRNKAYGTLEDELESTLFGKNSILFNQEDDEKTDIDTKDLDNLTDDISKELDELLLKKEKNSRVSKSKELENKDDDLLNFIDSTLYKEEEEQWWLILMHFYKLCYIYVWSF